MSSSQVIFLLVFIVVLSVFAYINTREGFLRSLSSLLRLVIPMLLSGIIVKISQLISRVELVSYIIGGIGTVIFFLVLKNAIKNPEKKKVNIVGHFLGFLVGIVEGWLVSGVIVLYLDFFKVPELSKILAPAFYQSIVLPVKWILFLDFIRF